MGAKEEPAVTNDPTRIDQRLAKTGTPNLCSLCRTLRPSRPFGQMVGWPPKPVTHYACDSCLAAARWLEQRLDEMDRAREAASADRGLGQG